MTSSGHATRSSHCGEGEDPASTLEVRPEVSSTHAIQVVPATSAKTRPHPDMPFNLPDPRRNGREFAICAVRGLPGRRGAEKLARGQCGMLSSWAAIFTGTRVPLYRSSYVAVTSS